MHKLGKHKKMVITYVYVFRYRYKSPITKVKNTAIAGIPMWKQMNPK